MFVGILKLSEDSRFNVSIPAIPGLAHMTVLVERPNCSLNIRKVVLAVRKRHVVICRKSSIVEPRLKPGIVQNLVAHAAIGDSTLNDCGSHRIDRSNDTAGFQLACAQGLSRFKVEV